MSNASGLPVIRSRNHSFAPTFSSALFLIADFPETMVNRLNENVSIGFFLPSSITGRLENSSILKSELSLPNNEKERKAKTIKKDMK